MKSLDRALQALTTTPGLGAKLSTSQKDFPLPIHECSKWVDQAHPHEKIGIYTYQWVAKLCLQSWSEERYTKIEKFMLAIIISAKKLKPYFKAHQIVILIDLLPRTILHKLNSLSSMMKCRIELDA